ncbi:MAG: hypothetical protein EAZ92_04655 [Candidatus Kapaibacterium sp.]|nr:MAG: hypothetical protein EAZ92_04655 [Candidatus Kapabacteria bacterium]
MRKIIYKEFVRTHGNHWTTRIFCIFGADNKLILNPLHTHLVNTFNHTLQRIIARLAAFSFALGIQSFVLQCLTGILLMTQYEPSVRPAESATGRNVVMLEITKTLRHAPTKTTYTASELLFAEYDTATNAPIYALDTLRSASRIITHPDSKQALLPNAAYFSVEQAIMRGADYGWLVRGIHQAAANILVASILLAALCVCTLRIMIQNSNEQTSKQAALVCLGAACVLGSGITGYILPFDTRSFAALEIALSTLQSAPLLGNALAGILRGGSALGTATLLKMTTLHFILLPSLTIACFWAIRHFKQGNYFEMYFGSKKLEHGIIACALTCACVCWAGYATSLAPTLPADLTQAPLHTPADVPAWYAYPAYLALKMFPANFVLGASIGAVLLCGAVLIFSTILSIPRAVQRSIDAALLVCIAAWSVLSLWGIVQHLALMGGSHLSIRENVQETIIVTIILTLVNAAILLALKRKSA